jgi:UDPglucose 6-dehydrogenase
MKIAMIGTGYVGLVTGACLADWGHSVVCVDNNRSKIAALKEGVIPIYEPGLDQLVAATRERGLLSFSTHLSQALNGADAVFIAVGTPSRGGDGEGEADLSFVYAAAQEIGRSLDHPAVVVVKSTVPVGTGDTVERILVKARPSNHAPVVSNPEFLREGSAISDFQNPDRVVIGTEGPSERQVMLQIYAPLLRLAVPIVTTHRRTAELIKYAANSFLATKITYINEMADLCERVGADIMDLSLALGLDSRIGSSFLKAGPGYGGSCFPKDTLALLRTAQDFGVPLRIVEESVSANNARKRRMALKVSLALGGSVDGLTIAVFGLSFKPNTDDMRNAPCIPLIEALQKGGAWIRGFDPVAMEQAAKVVQNVTMFDNPYACAQGVDALVLVTDWREFKTLDLARLRKGMAGDVIVDLRNIIDPDEALRHGLHVTNVGTAASHPDGSLATLTNTQPNDLFPATVQPSQP